MKLPAGRYVIDRISCSDGTETERFPSHIEFAIEPGKVTYLGEFLVVQVEGKSRIGLTMTQGWFVDVTDHQARDLEFAKQKGLDVAGAIISVPAR